jgi:hypothetical protein
MDAIAGRLLEALEMWEDDFAIAVENDAEAESIVFGLQVAASPLKRPSRSMRNSPASRTMSRRNHQPNRSRFIGIRSR